jgi:hypothetical protein
MSESAEVTDRFCAACGYNLRGIASDRCPECGHVFDPNQTSAPQIPWSHRHSIGRLRAFWRTVRLVSFRTRQFATEIHRPVSLADALAFRRLVALHLFIPLALLSGWAYVDLLHSNGGLWVASDLFGSLAQLFGLPVLIGSIWLFLMMAFGIGSYFFHPKSIAVRHQNRAVALSYYACGPWAYLLLVGPAIVGIFFAMNSLGFIRYRHDFPLGMAVGYTLIVGLFGTWVTLVWFTPVHLLARTTLCSSLRVVVFAIVQPLLLIISALLTVGVINILFWAAAFITLSFM